MEDAGRGQGVGRRWRGVVAAVSLAQGVGMVVPRLRTWLFSGMGRDCVVRYGGLGEGL